MDKPIIDLKLSPEEKQRIAASMETPIRCGGLDYCSKCNKPILRGQPRRSGDCECITT